MYPNRLAEAQCLTRFTSTAKGVASQAARTLFQEMIPIGVITSIIGCPFFLYLLSRREKRFF